jgi:hypothetical protein
VVVPGFENRMATFLPRLFSRALVVETVRFSQRNAAKPDG